MPLRRVHRGLVWVSGVCLLWLLDLRLNSVVCLGMCGSDRLRDVFARRGRCPPIGHIVQLRTAVLVKVLTLGARRNLLLLVVLLSSGTAEAGGEVLSFRSRCDTMSAGRRLLTAVALLLLLLRLRQRRVNCVP